MFKPSSIDSPYSRWQGRNSWSSISPGTYLCWIPINYPRSNFTDSALFALLLKQNMICSWMKNAVKSLISNTLPVSDVESQWARLCVAGITKRCQLGCFLPKIPLFHDSCGKVSQMHAVWRCDTASVLLKFLKQIYGFFTPSVVSIIVIVKVGFTNSWPPTLKSGWAGHVLSGIHINCVSRPHLRRFVLVVPPHTPVWPFQS